MSLHHPYLTCVHVVVHIQPNDRDARIVCNKVSRHFTSLLLTFVIKHAIVMCTAHGVHIQPNDLDTNNTAV